MKQLSINVARDTKISDLSCTPNTIVLAKQSTRITDNGVTTNVRYMEVCHVEKTDAVTILSALTRYIVAEFFVKNDFETKHADTGIKQQKLFNQFLNNNFHIYRTNAEGKIVNALESEVPLNRTGLNVKPTHAIVTCKPENRKAAIFQHSKATVAQFTYRSSITQMAEMWAKQEKEAEKAAEQKKAEAKAETKKPKTASRTTFATVPPAMSAAPAQ